MDEMVGFMPGADVQDGRGTAFRELVRRYADRVYTQAYRMLGNREDAEEAVQDIFLKVHRGIVDFRGDSQLTTWLWRITANVCISRLRRKQLAASSLDDPVGDDGATMGDHVPSAEDDPLEYTVRADTAALVRDYVRMLPPAWAMAVSMFYFDELTYDEIAAAIEVPSNTVATYLHRGRNRLARMLADRMGDEI